MKYSPDWTLHKGRTNLVRTILREQPDSWAGDQDQTIQIR